jgi:S-DNA-T family DNA segregation ATPase FtsK/SpoIIIE
MTKRSGGKANIDWRAGLTSPLLQQILALLTMALGIITLLALFRVTRGRWAAQWVALLKHGLGWGAYPTGVAIVLAGLLWLQHQLDRPVRWRWRPFVGAELVIFGLLALTHTLGGLRTDPWMLVESGWGGGLVGWGVSTLLSRILGWPTVLVLLSLVVLFGLGLTFDLTVDDLKRLWARWSDWRARRAALPTAGRETTAKPQARRRPAGSAPAPRPAPRPAPAAQSKPPQARPMPPVREVAPAAARKPDEKPSPIVRAPIKQRERPAPAPVERSGPLSLPPLDLLNDAQGPSISDQEIRKKSRIIERTLAQFGLPVEVAEVRVGPTITQFGLKPGYVERSGADRKVRVGQISALADDLALALASPRLRVEAPVPGRAIVGIEVPNDRIQLVGVREVMDSEVFDDIESPLAFPLGRDVSGEPVAGDLSRMPHLLIAGTTGSGKSVCIKALTTCLIYNNTPEELRLVMIDPKMVELVRFNGLPHLYGEVEVDLERIVRVLRWVAREMDNRYRRFAEATARNIDDYNVLMGRRGGEPMPRIVVLIDELADLMMMAPDEVERTICRIAQMARATGIHLVVATQRPSVDVVTGLIKANFPARISFATASQTDSRVILDMPGAETLLGKGDMLYLASDAGHPARVQGCFVSEEEVERVVDFWRQEAGTGSQEAPWEQMITHSVQQEEIEDEYDVDPELLEEAIELVQTEGNATASLLQRKLRVGHPRAARLMEVMEEMGVIGPPKTGGKARRVIIGGEEDVGPA